MRTRISRNAPCPCGSGNKYKHCCGEQLTAPTHNSELYTRDGFFRNPIKCHEESDICLDQPNGYVIHGINIPPGVLLIENFIAAEKCREIVEYAAKTPGLRLKIHDTDSSTDSRFAVKESDSRITEYVPLGIVRDMVLQIFDDLARMQVTRHYHTSIEWYAEPGILRYLPGGKYDLHSDSENWNYIENRWIRGIDRDYSVILYLNEEFEGGTLYFPNFKFRIKPRRGMLIVFPSDHRYVHTAEQLISGVRYAVVSWMTANGSMRIFRQAPPGSRFIS